MPHATTPPDAVRWKCCVCHRSDNREEICIGVSGDQHWEHKRSDCEKYKKFPARTKSMGERLLENAPVTMGTEELGEGTRNSALLSDKRATKVSHNNQLDVPDLNDRILIWECKCGNSNDGSEAQTGVTKRGKCRRKFKTSLKFSARLKVMDKKREVVDTTNLRQPFARFDGCLFRKKHLRHTCDVGVRVEWRDPIGIVACDIGSLAFVMRRL
jgi:hypothetical protein